MGMCFNFTSIDMLSGRTLLQQGRGGGKGKGKDKGQGNQGCKGTTYTVKAGDTLSGLANSALKMAEKCSVQKIAQANGIQNVNRITVGQKLCLPKGCAQPEQKVSSHVTTPWPAVEAAWQGSAEFVMLNLLCKQLVIRGSMRM